jgi:hypothetical protein
MRGRTLTANRLQSTGILALPNQYPLIVEINSP